MAMIKCKECGAKISSKAKACPSCGAPAKKKTSAVTWLVTFILVAGVLSVATQDEPTPAERKAHAEAKKEQEIARAKKKAEDKRKGFHCLSPWDGSHRDVEKYVKRAIRDPDSYEHVKTRISPVKDGKHNLTMTFRARNGYGGMNVNSALAVIDNDTCKATNINIY